MGKPQDWRSTPPAESVAATATAGPRYLTGLVVAVLIIAGVAVSQGALTPAPSPPSSPTAVARASTSDTLQASPVLELGTQVQVGPLDPGTYADLDVDGQGFDVQFTVPAGWSWDGRYLSKGGDGGQGGAAIFFFGGPVHVYADPCHWDTAQPTRSTGPAAAAIVAALAAQPSRQATTPVDRPANAPRLAGLWPGKAVELTVPDDLDPATCDGGQYRSWGPDGNLRAHQVPGQRDLVWVLDLIGGAVGNARGPMAAVSPTGGLIVDAASFPATPASVMSEIDAILASMYIG